MRTTLPTYRFYKTCYRGALPKGAFDEALPAAERHVRWLCGGRVPCKDEVRAYKRAVCACADVFAEYGQGPISGFAIGDFRMGNLDANAQGGTAEDIATKAAMEELSGCLVAFCGVL